MLSTNRQQYWLKENFKYYALLGEISHKHEFNMYILGPKQSCKKRHEVHVCLFKSLLTV